MDESYIGGGGAVEMWMQEVPANGRITIPEELLQHLGIVPGEQVDIEMVPGGALLLSATTRQVKNVGKPDRLTPNGDDQ